MSSTLIWHLVCDVMNGKYSSRSGKLLTIYLDPTHLLFWIGSRHLTRLFFPPHTSYEGTNPGLHKHTTFPDRWNICQIMVYKYQVELRLVCIFSKLMKGMNIDENLYIYSRILIQLSSRYGTKFPMSIFKLTSNSSNTIDRGSFKLSVDWIGGSRMPAESYWNNKT